MPIELDDIRSGYNLSKINSNFQRIEDAWDEKLDRLVNDQGNQMEQQLDMNSNKIINHPPTDLEEPTDLVRVDALNQFADFTGSIPVVASYVGDGTTVAFPKPVNANDARTFQVYVGGLRQEPYADYQIVGETVVFTQAPVLGVSVDIYGYSPTVIENGAPVYADPILANFTGDGTTTNFFVSAQGSGTDSCFISIDGVNQVPNTDFTNAGGAIQFTEAPPLNSEIFVRIFAPFTNNATDSFVIADGSTEARRLGDRFAETVTPEDFGAVGNGSVDDTAAVQAMFNYVNKDSNFNNTMPFPIGTGPEIGIGEIPLVSLKGDSVYAVSDEIIVSAGVTIEGNGAAFKAIGNMDGKAVLRVKYDWNNDGNVQIYGCYNNKISNIRIDGNGNASCGILLEKCNSGVFEHIYICDIVQSSGNYWGAGIRLEEVQYSSFINVQADNNYIGWELASSPTQLGLRCIDNSFYNCSGNHNTYAGLHISNSIGCGWYRFDCSRNRVVGIIFDNDNNDPDGNTASSISSNNIFHYNKHEYTSDDQPSSGYCININEGNAYNNVFYNGQFSQQTGGDGQPARYRWMRNIAFRNTLINPTNGQQQGSTLARLDAVSSEVYPIFQSNRFDGIKVIFQGWEPDIDDLRGLSVDDSGTLLNPGDTRVSLNVLGRYQYNSNTSLFQGNNTAPSTTFRNNNNVDTLGLGGRIWLGGGTLPLTGNTDPNDDAPRFTGTSDNQEVLFTNGRFGVNGLWNDGALRMGSYYLWVDGSGNLRIKQFLPNSDTDGVVVGTQS